MLDDDQKTNLHTYKYFVIEKHTCISYFLTK